MKTKRILSFVMLILIGFISGVLTYALLEYSTNDLYIETIINSYISDQQIESRNAIDNGDIFKAMIHQYNVVYSFSDNEYSSITIDSLKYDIFKPFRLIYLEKLENANNISDKAIMVSEGLEIAKLAYLFDKLEYHDMAECEWSEAYRLTNFDLDEFKERISDLMGNK